MVGCLARMLQPLQPLSVSSLFNNHSGSFMTLLGQGLSISPVGLWLLSELLCWVLGLAGFDRVLRFSVHFNYNFGKIIV